MIVCRHGLAAAGLIALLGQPPLAAAAAASAEPRPPAARGSSQRNDTSAPLRELAPPLPPLAFGFRGEVPNPVRPNFVPPDGPGPPNSRTQAAPGPSLTPSALLSVEGLSADDDEGVLGFRVVPPDTNGDIGYDGDGNKIYIQYINLIWQVYDAVNGAPIGTPMAGNSFWSGFGGDCETHNDGDPLVLYDDQAGRWVFAQFVVGSGRVCFAVSTTSDPLDSYHRYEFTLASPTGTADYPKLGVWAQDAAGEAPAGAINRSAYTLMTRNFPFTTGAFSHSILLERDRMLAGASAQFVSFSHPCTLTDCVEGQLPPHQAGAPPPLGTCPTFMTIVDAGFDDTPSGADGVRLHRVCVDWSDTAGASMTESFAASGVDFDRALGSGFGVCISPVPSPGETLACLAGYTMYRAQYRYFDGTDGNGSHASVVLNTTVDAGSERGGLHWLELRSTDGETGWSVHQEGTYAPADGVERWMGSIAQDGDRNIALGYSSVSGSRMPSLHYTSRRFGDPLGTMGGEATCHGGSGVQTDSSGRWGDYSSMSVDPEDDCTFWFTGEYYETTGSFDFATRICSFRLCNLAPAVAITQPTDGETFDDTTSIVFAGTADDSEDGDLSTALAWTSSLDGAIGGGGSFSTTLSAGPHTVEATVTDSGGESSTDSISLTVTGAGCPAHLDILGPLDVEGPDTRRAVQTIDVAGEVTVTATGELVLLAGTSVALGNGLTVESGGRLDAGTPADPCG